MLRFGTRTQHPILETLGQIAMMASVLVAILYPFYVLPFDPILVKGSAVSLLALYTIFRVRNFDHVLLIVVLLANSVGDMQIAGPEPDAMYRAMNSFMAGHVILILVFMRNRLSVYDVSSGRIGAASLLWGAAALGIFLMWPELGEERNQLITYAAALVAMATAALFSRFEYKLVGYGALFFVISDTLIAGRVFFDLPDWTNVTTWGLYYLSQVMITAGILLAPDRDKSLRYS